MGQIRINVVYGPAPLRDSCGNLPRLAWLGMAPDGHTRRTTAEGFVVHGGDSKEHDRAAEVLLKTAREVNLREAGIKEIAEALAHYAQG